MWRTQTMDELVILQYNSHFIRNFAGTILEHSLKLKRENNEIRSHASVVFSTSLRFNTLLNQVQQDKHLNR